jgi:hypothetical protein
MALTMEEIRSEALRLSAQERARLAKELITSLDELEAEDEAAVEAAWRDETRRRLEQFRRGELEAEDGPALMEKLRSRFRR